MCRNCICSNSQVSKYQSVGIQCTTGFLPYYRSSRLVNTRSVRKVNAFWKQAANVLSGTRNFKTFDRHMSTMFDWPSHSRAPFAGERRFVRKRFLPSPPLPHPLLPIFCSSPIFLAGKTPKTPFFANAFYAGYVISAVGISVPSVFCIPDIPRIRSNVKPEILKLKKK